MNSENEPVRLVSGSELARRAGATVPTALARMRQRGVEPDAVLIVEGGMAPTRCYFETRAESIIEIIRRTK